MTDSDRQESKSSPMLNGGSRPDEGRREEGAYSAYGYGYSAYSNQGKNDRDDSVFWFYLDLFLRRIWVVITVLVIVLVIGIVKAFREPRVYQSTVRVLVEKQAPKLMQFQGVGQDYVQWDPDFFNTQAGIVKSRSVMELALKDPAVSNVFAVSAGAAVGQKSSFLAELRETMVAVLGATPVSPPEPWEMLKSQIIAEPVKNTHFVNVVAEDTDPERAALLVNSVAKAFEQYSFNEKVDLLGQSFSYLEKEKEKEEKAVAAAEDVLKKYLEKNPGLSLADTGGQGNPAVQRMGELNAELGKVHLARIEIMAELDSMKSIVPASKSDIKASSEVLFSSPVVRREVSLMSLRGRLEEAERNLQVLSNTYGSEHPQYRTAETNIALLRGQFLEGFNQAIKSREKDAGMLASKEEEIQKQYDEQKKSIVGLTTEVNSYIRLKSEVDRHRHLYEALVSRLLEVDVSGGLVQGSVKVVDRGKVPSKPVRPDRVRIILFSMLIGMFLGFGLAFVFENLDQTIKTPEDLKERTGLPLLGFIPRMASGASKKDDKPSLPPSKYRKKTAFSQHIRKFLAELLRGVFPSVEQASMANEPIENVIYRGTIVATEPASSVTEAFRHVRTSLFFSVPAGEMKVIVLTSSIPGEGKTTTCTNLAAVVAQSGKKVLLIDADLHRPMVRKIMKLKSKVGLTDVLAGKIEWQQAVQQPEVNGTPIVGLHILCAGTRTPNPAELIGSLTMRMFISQVRQSYDWIIFDTPPVLFVSDASILGALCDGVVLVVKSGTSARSLLARTKDQLETVHAKIIGTILGNMHLALIGRHYSYYYHHGYSRYAKDYKTSYYGNNKSRHASEDPED